MNYKFGTLGYNPALACAQIMYEITQFDTPNTFLPAEDINKYVWAYIIGPIFGAVLGGFLSLIHQKCVRTPGQDNDKDHLID